MSIKKILLLLLASALFSVSAQADKLRVGVEGAYPPFSWKEADGTLKGFDIDFAMEVCKRLGRECVLVEQEWDGMIPALLAKKFDTIIASMSITEERKKKVDFTVKYYNTPPGVVAKKNAGFEQSAAGLKGKRLGVQRATTHQCTAEKMFPDAELVLYATQEEVWQEDELVGGLYGVVMGRCFFGESMFSWSRDASKVGLATLVEHLQRLEFELLDCQMPTDHLASLGARGLARDEFLLALKSAGIQPAVIPDPTPFNNVTV